MVSFLVAVAALCVIYKCCPTLGNVISGCGCAIIVLALLAVGLVVVYA